MFLEEDWFTFRLDESKPEETDNEQGKGLETPPKAGETQGDGTSKNGEDQQVKSWGKSAHP